LAAGLVCGHGLSPLCEESYRCLIADGPLQHQQLFGWAKGKPSVISPLRQKAHRCLIADDPLQRLHLVCRVDGNRCP